MPAIDGGGPRLAPPALGAAALEGLAQKAGRHASERANLLRIQSATANPCARPNANGWCAGLRQGGATRHAPPDQDALGGAPCSADAAPVAALAALAAPRLAAAQAAWPAERPIEVVVPAPPGGALDSLARMLMPHVCARLGEAAKFVVINRPGAGTQIGNEAVFNAAPDGYTLGCITAPALPSPADRAPGPLSHRGVHLAGQCGGRPQHLLRPWALPLAQLGGLGGSRRGPSWWG